MEAEDVLWPTHTHSLHGGKCLFPFFLVLHSPSASPKLAVSTHVHTNPGHIQWPVTTCVRDVRSSDLSREGTTTGNYEITADMKITRRQNDVPWRHTFLQLCQTPEHHKSHSGISYSPASLINVVTKGNVRKKRPLARSQGMESILEGKAWRQEAEAETGVYKLLAFL